MRTIGNTPVDGDVRAVASGALANGNTVVVNADGTVSVVAETSASQALGSPVVFQGASINGNLNNASCYDANAQKIVVVYKTAASGSNKGTAVVGTVSGTTISFGTPAVFENAVVDYVAVAYDANAQKVVIAYNDAGNNANGTAVVGTVSGTNISFGTPAVYNPAATYYNAITYDAVAQKVVIAYRDAGNGNDGTAVVGTVSGTDISFGSETVFETGTTSYIYAVYDTNAQKVVIAYMDDSNVDKGTAVVGTVSGTSITFGSPVIYETGDILGVSMAYDSTAQKVVIAYANTSNSFYGTAIVGTVSGTSISFGSSTVFKSGSIGYSPVSVAYNAAAQKVIIAYIDEGNGYYATAASGTVSGTSISFGTDVALNSSNSNTSTPLVYDENAKVVVLSYEDQGNNRYGTSVVFQSAYTSTNLTSENYIGIAKGAAADGTSAVVNSTCTVSGVNTEVIVEGYDLSVAAYDNKSLLVSSYENRPLTVAISSDGTKLYVAGQTGDAIDQWTLSTAFDVSTGVYDSVTFSYATTAGTNVQGMFFKPDGTKFYLTDDQNNKVYAYTMSSAWDLSTASHDTGDDFSVVAQTSANTNGIAFNSTGTKFLTIGSPSGVKTIFQYNLSTAWDITSASYSTNSLNISGQTGADAGGIQFNSDDTEFYVTSGTADDIFQYNMTTAGDLSSASYSNVSFSTAPETSYLTAMYFGDSGSKLYVCSFSNDTIFQYSTGSVYDPSMTAGQSYFVQKNGRLALTPDDPSVFAGTAVSASKLIVKG